MTELAVNRQVSLVHTVLKLTFGLVPIVAGLDKFVNLLTDWSVYVSPAIGEMLPVSVSTLFVLVGLVEIAAGLLVLVRPQVGAYVVMAWLILVALIIVPGGHIDVAVRDLVMAVGAFVLAKLSALPSSHNAA